MKPTKKGNVAFANGYNRIKQTRHGYMLYNSNDIYVGGSFDAYGEFSEAEVQFVLSLVNSDGIAMDIGANYGALTIPLARKARHVYAFEPQREAFYALAGSLALNCLSNVSCENVALADRPGFVRVPRLDLNAPNNIGGLSMNIDRMDPAGYDVRAETLDGYVARNQINRLDLLKIDVEGMEEQVLRGGAATIRRLRPVMYIEADRPDRVASLKACVAELGYTHEPHEPLLFSPSNFFNNPVNVWGRNIASFNMVCRPGPAGPPEATQ